MIGSDPKILKVKVLPGGRLPQYQTEGAAGLDLHASEECEIMGYERALVPTGIAIELAPGYEAQVRSRSGMATNAGVGVAFLGTVDSDYRGPVKVLLLNTTAVPYYVAKGDRIAQLVIARVQRVLPLQVDELSETARGAGGFGSTGTK